jgi:menaquinone-specific isochorismate synthase
LWLQSLTADKKIYWRDREHRFEFAGIGEAHVLDLSDNGSLAALDTLSDTLRDSTGDIKYFGGLRFDNLCGADRHNSVWQSFGQGWLTLPRVALMVRGGRSTLACHLMPHEATLSSLDRIAQSILDLRVDTAVCDESPMIVTRTDSPDSDVWERNVATVLKAITDGRCQKTVLARQTSLELSTPANPWRVLTNLRHHADHLTLFGIQHNAGAVFLGASPERLYYRSGTKIESEALAGSRKRGATAEIDAILCRELLNSTKDRHEHELVVSSIRTHLSTVCDDLVVDSAPEALKVAHVQHLRTRIAGRLRSGAVDGRLLSLMHPTPAVNGYPRTSAMSLIRELEPFDRGWYAGPIGWVGPGEAEFAVAIRSALIEGSRALVYAGAGIVEGSSPEQEWAELESKISPLISALNEVK